MIQPENAALVLIDIQGKLAQLMFERDRLFTRLRQLIDVANLFDMPILWMEQLPDKLGPTVPDIAEKLDGLSPMAKSTFSCFRDAGFKRALAQSRRRHLILAGIESHICVYQSCRDALSAGFEVSIVQDAISSRTEANYRLGLERMVMAGAAPVSVEMLAFDMQQVAEGPRFRQMIQLFRDA
ncbi:hydrolase [Hahella sp. SMD15-11]|uniref:Hydrolase n=1 Tax=Thermohahella caldifontis TaxID=3142973 RepID=A0AB39UZS1_9GAMM